MGRTIFLAGHAALPQGMAAKGLYDHLAIVAEVDKKYGVVVNVQCTLVTALANEIVQNTIRGYCLKDGIEELIKDMSNIYRGAARNAIIAALKDLDREYTRHFIKKD